MRDFIVGTLLLSSGVFFSLGFAYADFGLLQVSVVFALLTAVFLVGEFVYLRRKAKRESESATYTCIRYGDEFFLRNELGYVRQSSRTEVFELNAMGRITNWK
jgi:hypothetical protein